MKKTLEDSRRIVVKIGSNVLSDKNGNVNRAILENIVSQLIRLMKLGKQVVVVSSGAGICGVGAINKWSRRNDINYKQALCAIGQVELMMGYKDYFAAQGIHVAQMLLTRYDFKDPLRNLNIRNTLFTLIDEGVVPVINENDTVSVDEIRIGDNDTLSAHTAMLCNADVLITLSDIDGVFESNPKDNPDALLIAEVSDTDKLLKNIDTNGKSSFGTGGIETKISAAGMVNEYGISMVLLNGKQENIIDEAMKGTARGTLFRPDR